jgi:hypothetical protein
VAASATTAAAGEALNSFMAEQAPPATEAAAAAGCSGNASQRCYDKLYIATGFVLLTAESFGFPV